MPGLGNRRPVSPKIPICNTFCVYWEPRAQEEGPGPGAEVLRQLDPAPVTAGHDERPPGAFRLNLLQDVGQRLPLGIRLRQTMR